MCRETGDLSSVSMPAIPFYAIKRLQSLGFRTYADYLRSPEWAAVKWRYRRSKRPQGCQLCGAKPVDLHHRTYKRIGGKEHLSDLVALCRQHHDQAHAEHQGDPQSLHRATRRNREQTRADQSRR
jgi:hypothetical protein